ncbi:glycoside hydrolase family 3 protein [Thalassomonas sp. M1454]|uniref:glycoside hydrolase family 3 protein n=1 Tax=Thalassomonas sp. M1454 TaxID=2594477 RepID=UPI0011802311|nr:exo 1,3/1,4-beta-D-glucan glucohydrolase [Thalassomonas sp. M1454]TRX53836.1 glycoside hydrolase family 3 protein [Thalassomonas sp. M1454]
MQTFKTNYLAKHAKYLMLSSITLATLGCSQEQVANDHDVTAVEQKLQHNIDIWPTLELPVKKDAVLEKKIADILSGMTLEQKVAQMIQPEIRDITVEDMRKYGFGSFLNGGGAFPENNKHATPADWIKLAEDLYQASIDDSIDGSTIPTIWGTDAVHGHNNVIGATLFPHNIGLGAANNPDLIEEIAAITATEVMVTGIDWVFAPTVAVVRDDRWGRTYEGYSEDPEIVREYSASIVKGLQGPADQDFLGDTRVISTVKHFLGDGGTIDGDDQGNNIASEQELFDIHGQGYVGGLSAGAQSVMASFNSWHGEKNHGNEYLLTTVLKDKMGFDGFVVGDWNGHGQIPGCTNDNCAQTVNAGLDIFMVPTDAWKPLYENTIAQVKSGEISQARIDDAVSRILRVKLRAGIFDKPSPAKRALSGKTELIGAQAHRDVARQAVRESLVLLKNKDNILPLNPKANILVAGDGADNIGKQSGGWSITWQGTGNTNADFPGGTSIYDGFKDVVNAAGGNIELSVAGEYKAKPDVAVVVFGEEPYAEGIGDIDNLDYQRGNKKDLALLNKLKAQGIPVVSVFISGRPMWVNAELNASDAFVAAWLPGSEGNGVSEVLFTKADGSINYDFTGKLSFSWPKTATQAVVNRNDANYAPLLPYGFGLSYGDKNVLADDLDETVAKSADADKAMVLFEHAAKAPWAMNLISGDKSSGVDSSIVELASIKLKTMDKDVQEDARTITFKGTEKAMVSLRSTFVEDLRAQIENKSALTVLVRKEQSFSDKVFLEMHCDEANCQYSIDVTSAMQGFTDNEWQELSVDLNCFVEQGLNPARVTLPFGIATSGSGQLSFSTIKLQPNKADNATVSCQ